MNTYYSRDELVESLIALIERGHLLDAATFPVDCDSAMDLRDDEVFDAQWMRVYKLVYEKPPSDCTDDTQCDLREIAFKATFKATHNADVAAAASDDFGLIAQAIMLDWNDGWLNGLWAAYSSHQFPCGAIKSVGEPLHALVRKCLSEADMS